MKAVFYYLSSLLVFAASVMPNTSLRDTETLQDSSASAQSSLQMGTMSMTDKDSSMMSSSSEDGQQVTNIGDKSDEVSDTSELPGFNLSLFPTASIFGANPMFQKLQESLRVIRDQLNTLWSLNEDSYPSFDIPDNYVNSTSYSKLVNGTLVTVNETIYKDGIQSFYHTKAISIYPDNDTDSTLHKQHVITHEKETRIDNSAMRDSGNSAEEVDIEIENSTEIHA
ncbi:hypothetical protein DAPPUDRAFT_302249 [Daphnia pulex]|uniref:Uncharacterized protein n=1 Tax=Daphnia pulex TaxID=6669 RepID=E9HMQ1_DAPPU|nr:hypothetical protein DAPPUDRAFT_302249 [Daphnia pulex]|eukprot:EFX66962.1 hypothetical protein DAPPUDRAFT_302249 [Daphnia pulex]